MTTFDSVKEEIRELYSEVPELVKTIREDAIENLDESELKNAGRPFLVGSGAGYAAALAAKTVFRDFTAWTGEYINASTPIKFSSQLEDFEIGKEPRLITFNIDGADGCQKAADRAVECGGSVVSLTVDGSDVSEGGGVFTCENGSDVCGAASYVRGLAMAIGYAEAEGLLDGTLDEELISVFDDQLGKTCKSLVEKLDDLGEHALNAAKDLVGSDAEFFETIGTSWDYASAWLIRYIIYKFAGVVTTVEESEDYLHVNALTIGTKRFSTFIVNTVNNPAYDITLYTIRNVTGGKRFGVVITDGMLQDYDSGLKAIFKLDCSKINAFKPLFTHVPAELMFAAYKDLTEQEA